MERSLKRGEAAQKATIRAQAAQAAGGSSDHGPSEQK